MSAYEHHACISGLILIDQEGGSVFVNEDIIPDPDKVFYMDNRC